MRILVCAALTPYPPAGGGRADVWRRIQAFIELGHSVMLVHQFDPAGPLVPTTEHLAAMDEVLQARFTYPVKHGPRRIIQQVTHLWLPWGVAKAIPASTESRELETAVRLFEPDLIWLDGPWLGAFATRIAAAHRLPIAYRSHNVEHLYLRRQAGASRSLRSKVTWRLATIGLKRYELSLMKASRRVLDISLDDLAYWQQEGVKQAHWLPPLPELALTGPPTQMIPGDVVFVGGLRLPNNVSGVRWLLNEVLPAVHRTRPEVTVSVVGSTPLPDLMAELAANPAVRAFYNVPSVYPYLFGGKVLVNPVSVGSGVQLKMLDMLMTEVPIVTRSQGTRGLPAETVAQFEVADSAEGFAAAILTHLGTPGVDARGRERSRQPFTVAAVGEALEGLIQPT